MTEPRNRWDVIREEAREALRRRGPGAIRVRCPRRGCRFSADGTRSVSPLRDAQNYVRRKLAAHLYEGHRP